MTDHDSALEQRLRRTLQHVAATVTDDDRPLRSVGQGLLEQPDRARAGVPELVAVHERRGRHRRTALVAAAAAVVIGAAWAVPFPSSGPERLATGPPTAGPSPTWVEDPARTADLERFREQMDDCAESRDITVRRLPGGGSNWGVPPGQGDRLNRVRAECQQELDVSAYEGVPAQPTGLRICDASPARSATGECTELSRKQAHDLVLHLFLHRSPRVPPCEAGDGPAYLLTFRTTEGPAAPLTMPLAECAPLTGHGGDARQLLPRAARELVRDAHRTGNVPTP